MNTSEQLKQLAKIELHCHLDGSLSLETIRTLAQWADIALPDSDDDLKTLVTVPETINSLSEYLKTFDIIRPLLQTQKALRLAAYDVARQAAQENVLYTEIRYAPELSMDQGLSASDTFFAVLEGLADAQREFGIESRIIICGLRQSSHDLTRNIFEEIQELRDAYLGGFDFAGDEANFPPHTVADIVRDIQSPLTPFTLHAGECGCSQHIAAAISLGAKRIGHASAITSNPQLIQEFIKHHMTAELCLTSNLQTKAISNIEAFPYLSLYQAGANITINTDNRTVSNTSLTQEYILYQQYFNTTISDFYQFNCTAVAAAFTTKQHKQLLLSQLKAAYSPFL